ncbi:hypothetical protein [Afifella sp. YEN Y35]|uniref:hypothetical protein n=1 Tax=Afifella sp. YEN Y35 TaxID=3388337 RepID=UPI0039E0D568
MKHLLPPGLIPGASSYKDSVSIYPDPMEAYSSRLVTEKSGRINDVLRFWKSLILRGVGHGG